MNTQKKSNKNNNLSDYLMHIGKVGSNYKNKINSYEINNFVININNSIIHPKKKYEKQINSV